MYCFSFFQFMIRNDWNSSGCSLPFVGFRMKTKMLVTVGYLGLHITLWQYHMIHENMDSSRHDCTLAHDPSPILCLSTVSFSESSSLSKKILLSLISDLRAVVDLDTDSLVFGLFKFSFGWNRSSYSSLGNSPCLFLPRVSVFRFSRHDKKSGGLLIWFPRKVRTSRFVKYIMLVGHDESLFDSSRKSLWE